MEATIIHQAVDMGDDTHVWRFLAINPIDGGQLFWLRAEVATTEEGDIGCAEVPPNLL